jgi:PKD repeat protein
MPPLRLLHPLRVRMLLLTVVGTVLGLSAGASAATAATPRGVDARVSTGFTMRGRVTEALRVRGEHRGERVTRQWSFTGRDCGRRSCRLLHLVRHRSGGATDSLTLHRTGPGTYTGSGRFFVGLTCLGHTDLRGESVPYRITVRILTTVTVQRVRFATRLQATYTNPARRDRTICPVGPSHDAATYSGLPAPLPTPPAAGFAALVNPGNDQATFADQSSPGAGAAPVVRRKWNFGDPASGAADTASAPDPAHTFTSPGIYSVTLTVTDAYGLTSTHTEQVVAPGPPTANFTAARTAAPLTEQFADASSSGTGGAAITAWQWSFGDPGSGPADTSTVRDPTHTFTGGPGTYTVCLTVTDTNQRQAAQCAPVSVS